MKKLLSTVLSLLLIVALLPVGVFATQDDGFVIEDGVLIKYTGAASVVVIPDSVVSIEENAFHDCGDLTEVVIPASVKKVDAPFDGCDQLRKIVVVSLQTELLHFGEYAESSMAVYAPKGSKAEAAAKESGMLHWVLAMNLSKLELPMPLSYTLVLTSWSKAEWKSSNSNVATVDQNGKVKAVGVGTATITAALGGADFSCEIIVEDLGLTEADSAEEFISYFFYETVYNGKAENWDDCNCTVLREPHGTYDPNLKPGVDCITLMHQRNTGSRVVVPDGIHGLCEGCPWGNKESIVSITLPDSLHGLGYETFLGMNNLKSINIPRNVRGISTRVFAYCKSLSEVTLPENMEYIGELAFLNCTSLKHIELPDGLKTIEDGAFEGSGLTEIVIPDSVKLLDNPFAGCEDLTKIVVTSPDTELKNFNKYGKTYATIYAPKGSKAESAAKKAGIPFKAIALNKTSLSLFKGKTYQLKVNSDSDAVWKSSNSKVVSVSKTGKIAAKANGTATITATLYGKKYTCKVTVKGNQTYTVKRGDSLWSIAAKQLGNGRRYTEIMKLNGLKSTKIVAGQKLKLPEK